MRSLTILLPLILAPLTAVAAPTVLYGPELDAASAAARASEYLETGDFRVAGPVEDLVVGTDGELVAQGIQLQRCPAETGALKPVLDVAGMQVLEMEFESAIGALEGAAKGLPCGARDATAEELFELFFLQGLAAFNDAREEDARAAFGAAAAITPTHPWPSKYPPTAKALYLESLQGALSSKTTLVQTDLTDLMLDGAVAENRRGVPLLAGRHVLKHGDDVALATAATSGGEARITTGGTLRVWLSNGADEAGPWLAEFARVQTWDRVVLLLGDRILELEGDVLIEKEVTVAKEGLPAAAVAGLGMIAGGAGVMGVGIGAWAQGWTDGELLKSNPTIVLNDPERDLVREYGEAVTINRVGFGLALGGGGVAAAGAVLTAVTLTKPNVQTVTVAPLIAPVEGGVVVGVSGRF